MLICQNCNRDFTTKFSLESHKKVCIDDNMSVISKKSTFSNASTILSRDDIDRLLSDSEKLEKALVDKRKYKEEIKRLRELQKSHENDIDEIENRYKLEISSLQEKISLSTRQNTELKRQIQQTNLKKQSETPLLTKLLEEANKKIENGYQTINSLEQSLSNYIEKVGQNEKIISESKQKEISLNSEIIRLKEIISENNNKFAEFEKYSYNMLSKSKQDFEMTINTTKGNIEAELFRTKDQLRISQLHMDEYKTLSEKRISTLELQINSERKKFSAEIENLKIDSEFQIKSNKEKYDKKITNIINEENIKYIRLSQEKDDEIKKLKMTYANDIETFRSKYENTILSEKSAYTKKISELERDLGILSSERNDVIKNAELSIQQCTQETKDRINTITAKMTDENRKLTLDYEKKCEVLSEKLNTLSNLINTEKIEYNKKLFSMETTIEELRTAKSGKDIELAKLYENIKNEKEKFDTEVTSLKSKLFDIEQQKRKADVLVATLTENKIQLESEISSLKLALEDSKKLFTSKISELNLIITNLSQENMHQSELRKQKDIYISEDTKREKAEILREIELKFSEREKDLLKKIDIANEALETEKKQNMQQTKQNNINITEKHKKDIEKLNHEFLAKQQVYNTKIEDYERKIKNISQEYQDSLKIFRDNLEQKQNTELTRINSVNSEATSQLIKEYEKKILNIKAEITQTKDSEIKSLKSVHLSEKENLETIIKNLESKISDAEKKLILSVNLQENEYQSRIENIKKGYQAEIESLSEQNKNNRDEINSKIQEISRQKEEISMLTTKISQLLHDHEHMSVLYTNMEKTSKSNLLTINKLNDTILTLQNNLRKKQEEKSMLISELETEKENAKALSRQMQNMAQNNSDEIIKKEIMIKNEELKKLREQNAEYLIRINEFQSMPDPKEEITKKLRKMRDECLESIKKCRLEIIQLKTKNAELESKIGTELEISNAQAEINNKNTIISKLESTIKEYSEINYKRESEMAYLVKNFEKQLTEKDEKIKDYENIASVTMQTLKEYSNRPELEKYTETLNELNKIKVLYQEKIEETNILSQKASQLSSLRDKFRETLNNKSREYKDIINSLETEIRIHKSKIDELANIINSIKEKESEKHLNTIKELNKIQILYDKKIEEADNLQKKVNSLSAMKDTLTETLNVKTKEYKNIIKSMEEQLKMK